MIAVAHNTSLAMNHSLKAEGLIKKYKKRIVVNGVSVHVAQGEIVGLLGPNGAGKSTTFEMISGVVSPDGGTIHFDDIEMTKMPMFKRARLGIAYLPQEPSAFRGMTVEENVIAVLELNHYTKQQIGERLEEVTAELDMTSRRKIKAKDLSGGERRRLEVMRALALRPHFMLLDEPFAGVDPIAVLELQRIIVRMKEKNIGVLLTDHNVHETFEIANRAYVISEGKMIVEGTPSEIVNSDIVRKVFLGENFKMVIR